mmetsp:Transcript_7432/g.13217  ORF Transcript_7432/g.13217 Transcript_7432/m.13217 type:complete len:92 (-) Transcript_7432:55-330(-)
MFALRLAATLIVPVAARAALPHVAASIVRSLIIKPITRRICDALSQRTAAVRTDMTITLADNQTELAFEIVHEHQEQTSCIILVVPTTKLN